MRGLCVCISCAKRNAAVFSGKKFFLTKLNLEFYIMAKELEVYVNDELWVFNVSEAEFLAATGSKY